MILYLLFGWFVRSCKCVCVWGVTLSTNTMHSRHTRDLIFSRLSFPRAFRWNWFRRFFLFFGVILFIWKEEKNLIFVQSQMARDIRLTSSLSSISSSSTEDDASGSSKSVLLALLAGRGIWLISTSSSSSACTWSVFFACGTRFGLSYTTTTTNEWISVASDYKCGTTKAMWMRDRL